MEDVSFENARDQKVSVDTLQNIINDCVQHIDLKICIIL